MTTLKDCLMKGGIEGKTFVSETRYEGIITNQFRYKIVDIAGLNLPGSVTCSEDFSFENNKIPFTYISIHNLDTGKREYHPLLTHLNDRYRLGD